VKKAFPSSSGLGMRSRLRGGDVVFDILLPLRYDYSFLYSLPLLALLSPSGGGPLGNPTEMAQLKVRLLS